MSHRISREVQMGFVAKGIDEINAAPAKEHL
jgi:hypothetical protein